MYPRTWRVPCSGARNDSHVVERCSRLPSQWRNAYRLPPYGLRVTGSASQKSYLRKHSHERSTIPETIAARSPKYQLRTFRHRLPNHGGLLRESAVRGDPLSSFAAGYGSVYMGVVEKF